MLIFPINSKNIVNILTFILGFVYLSGYLINAIFLRNQGIGNISLIKAQFIETGLMFTIITALISVQPYYSFLFFHRIMEGKKYSIVKKYLIISFMTLVTVNFLWVLNFSIFFTHYDWSTEINIFKFTLGYKMRTIFTFYSIAFFVFVWLFRKVESLNIGRKWKESVTIPLRLIILLITVLFDIVLYQNIQWIGTVWNVVRFYIYALGGFTAITIWTRARFIKEEKDKNKYSFLMYAACFLIPLFYVMLTTYSNSIYI